MIIQALIEALQKNRLGHAMIFSHDSAFDDSLDLWNSPFADFLKALLCEEKLTENSACGQCSSCRLLENNLGEEDGELSFSHPDAVFIKPESQIKGYKVEQIREMSKAMLLKANRSPNKIAWISCAEGLAVGSGESAGNSLLKLLEEPRPNTYLILTSSKPQRILKTIQSRCQDFSLKAVLDSKEKSDKAVDERWSSFFASLLQVENTLNWGAAPADADSYWKDKEQAFVDLARAKESFWQSYKAKISDLNEEKARKILFVFERWAELERSLKFYANPPLQWASFREKCLRIST